jgi:hypothetical protein
MQLREVQVRARRRLPQPSRDVLLHARLSPAHSMWPVLASLRTSALDACILVVCGGATACAVPCPRTASRDGRLLTRARRTNVVCRRV